MEFIDKPQVFFVGETAVDETGLQRYFNAIGADKYTLDDELSGAEELIRTGGKLCYRSWQPELNPNVTRVRDDSKQYIGDGILKAAHGSVLEHASFSCIFHNISRVFTHELVRHRAGTAMSQESLRYVRLTDLKFWIPKILREFDNETSEGVQVVMDTVGYLERQQQRLAEIYAINDKPMALKKKLTSAFRRIAPIGLSTGILWTMNIRAARHIIQMRTDPSAEEEIRLIFDEVGMIAKERYPTVFQDFVREEVDGYGVWTTHNPANPYDKVKLTPPKVAAASPDGRGQAGPVSGGKI